MKLKCAFAALLLLAACSSEPPSSNLPNIVVIIADDLGWNDVGYHGGPFRTPNIDRFAGESVKLERFYVSPICSPTRAGILTGRYPIRFGMQRAVIPPWRLYGLDPKEVTIAEMLGEAGYTRRGAFGKWHLGHLARKWHPLEQGFTEFRGHYNGAIDYFTHEREGERDWHVGYEPSDEQGYSTDLIAKGATRFIRDNAKRGGFFCYVAFNAPHQPLQAPKDYLDMYASLPQPQRTMAAMITSMDDAIGRILRSIDDAGIRDNTFVWFISDNGGIKEFPASNRPLRGHKRQLFEGGIRVPACVRWPQAFSGGRELTAPTAYIDVFPTLAEVAGAVEHSGEMLDGIGLLTALKSNPSAALRDLYFYEGQDGRENEQVAVITPQWKLIILGKDVSLGLTDEHEVMLFDINDDPYEEHNIAPEHPDIVAELGERLVAFRALQPVEPVPPFNQGRAGFTPPKDWRIPGE